MNAGRLSRLLLLTLLLVSLIGVTAAVAQDTTESFGVAKLVFGQPYVPAQTNKPEAVQPDSSKLLPAAPGVGAVSTPVEDNKPLLTSGESRAKVFLEKFEGIWPNSLWHTYDNNGSGNGSYCWDDEDWIAYAGYWSAWEAGGCADGLDPNVDLYPNYLDSWAVYGPFSLKGKTAANLSFKYWNQSELNYDFFYWCASPDNVNYYCNTHSGDSGGWVTGKLNLKNVPGYGSLLGDKSVWVAFAFTSDVNIVDDGAFIDNAKLTVK